MKKLGIILALVLVVAVSFAGCSSSSSGGEKQFVTIATGGSSGAYFALGGTLSNLLNTNIDNVNSSVQSTGASSVNATLLGEKKADLAFAMNDVISYAYNGVETFAEKGKVENLRGVAALYPNFVQVISLKGNNINEIEDLKGKKVGVGAPGSGTEVNARQILNAHGITYDDINQDFLSYAESVEQLKNGTIDAAFLTSGIPNAAIMDLATTKDVKVVPIRKEKVEELAKDFPFYTPNVIPAGMYDNEEDVETAAVTTLLVTRAELSEELVYEITKTLFENLTSMGETHNSGKKISLDTAKVGMPIPLHPGAEKYYNEQNK